MKRYYRIEQTDGGMHTFPVDFEGEKTNAVGTDGCETCMCVYVCFEDRRVFIAHMIALSDTEYGSDEGNTSKADQYKHVWTSKGEKGEKLQAFLVEHLRSRLGDVESPVVEALVVCPAMLRDGARANGSYMRKAVEEFFDMNIEFRDGHGFVAGPDVETEIVWGDESLGDIGWASVNGVATAEESKDLRGSWRFLYSGNKWGLHEAVSKRPSNFTRAGSDASDASRVLRPKRTDS